MLVNNCMIVLKRRHKIDIEPGCEELYFFLLLLRAIYWMPSLAFTVREQLFASPPFE